jgi:hypothetical protein
MEPIELVRSVSNLSAHNEGDYVEVTHGDQANDGATTHLALRVAAEDALVEQSHLDRTMDSSPIAREIQVR